MSAPKTAPGWCVVCGRHTPAGLLLATVERNTLPPYDVVVHAGCQEARYARARARLAGLTNRAR